MSVFGKTQCTQVVKTTWVQRILLIFTFCITHRWGYYRANGKNCQCVLRSAFVVWTQRPVRMHRPKGGSGVPTPARFDQGEQMSVSEIWATGRILLSNTHVFSPYKKTVFCPAVNKANWVNQPFNWFPCNVLLLLLIFPDQMPIKTTDSHAQKDWKNVRRAALVVGKMLHSRLR